jgi:hypothetical protein
MNPSTENTLKHPLSIALSNSILQKIDKETSKQKSSRSDWIELHFQCLFSNKTFQFTGEIAIQLGFAGALDAIRRENENPTSKLVIVTRAHSAPVFSKAVFSYPKKRKDIVGFCIFYFLLLRTTAVATTAMITTAAAIAM